MSTTIDTDAQYRAIGRWFVAFSRVVMLMRLGIEVRFARESNVMEPKILLGGATADQIANAFFELCAHVAEPDGNERKILVWLRDEVKRQIRRRNDFAHGDWFLRSGEKPIEIWRVKPGRKAKAWTIKEYSPADLEGWADSLETLAAMVGEAGYLCCVPELMKAIWDKPVRLGEVYRYREGKGGKRGEAPAKGNKASVVRAGPLAGERSNMFAA